jgi:hypothetical protein
MKSSTKAPAKAPAAKAAPVKTASTTKAPAKTGTTTKAAAKPKTEVKVDPKPAPIEETKEIPKFEEKPKPELPKISEKELATLMEEFRIIPYTKLDIYLQASALNGKYVLIFDKTGQI